MSEIKKVWIMIVHHKHGRNYYVNSTYDGAYNSLYKYVKDEWGDAQELYAYHNPDKGRDLPIPEDKDEAIETYFGLQGEDGEEWYECEDFEVGP